MTDSFKQVQRKILRHMEFNTTDPARVTFDPIFLPTVDEVWNAAQPEIKRARSSPDTMDISDEDLKTAISSWLNRMAEHEIAARNPSKWDISGEKATSIKLIIVFSAPGTYLQAQKRDRYAGKEYTLWWDRIRADTAAILGIYIAGIQTGHDMSAFTKVNILRGDNKELNALKDTARAVIKEAGMRFLYIGNEEETSDIIKIFESDTAFIPKDNVEIIDGKIRNTYEQVKILKDYLLNYKNENKGIAFASHLQTIRMMCMCEHEQAIPADLTSYVIPIYTPLSGIYSYALDECKGTLYYVLTNHASVRPAPFELFGNT